MIRKLAALCGVLSLASATFTIPTASPATSSDALPPLRFQGDASAHVIFTDHATIEKQCGKAEPPKVTLACKRSNFLGQPIIFMPNPCPDGRSQYYARIMCHELGHVNGWTGEHEL